MSCKQRITRQPCAPCLRHTNDWSTWFQLTFFRLMLMISSTQIASQRRFLITRALRWSAMARGLSFVAHSDPYQQEKGSVENLTGKPCKKHATVGNLSGFVATLGCGIFASPFDWTG